MKAKASFMLMAIVSLAVVRSVDAQDLGPQFQKVKEGIYVYVGKEFNSNCGVILIQEGVVLIDSGHNPTDSRAILNAIKKLTSMPVRFLIDTEPHPDHTTGHFVFSPPAIVIAHEGASESMRSRERESPDRIQKMMTVSPEMRAALEGYRFIPPHIEYRQKMTLNG
jgi:glyoxylase-like metal-dependent hydrolase (beta-lactamase superfamily II)